MQVAVITGPGEVELRTEPDLTPAPDGVVVAVAATGLCTMERRLFAGEKKIYPVAAGHEVSGRVVAVGTDVNDLPGTPMIDQLVVVDLLTRCGTCRPCRRGRTALCQAPQGGALSDQTVSMGAGLADHVAVPARSVWRVGAADPALASMGEPLACTVHSLRRGGFTAGDRVAIIGAGFMGRLHLAVARLWGASEVGVVDVSDTRLADAITAGADWAITPDMIDDHRHGADLVIVTAGTTGSLTLALDLADLGGTAVLYGAFPKTHTESVGPDAVHHHETAIIGAYSQEPADWRAAAGILASRVLEPDLAALVTARFPLAEVGAALRLGADSPVYRVLVGGAA